MAQLVYECIIYGQQVAHPSLHLLGHHARMLPCRGIRSPVPGQTRVGSWVSKLKMTKRFAGPGGTVSFIRLPARMGPPMYRVSVYVFLWPSCGKRQSSVNEPHHL